jgi:hypothetical protein
MRYLLTLAAAASLLAACHNRSEDEVGAAPDRGDTTAVAADSTAQTDSTMGQAPGVTTGDTTAAGMGADTTSATPSDTTSMGTPSDTTSMGTPSDTSSAGGYSDTTSATPSDSSAAPSDSTKQ